MVREVKAALASDTAAGRLKLLELMNCGDVRVEMQAVTLLFAYGLGAPKESDVVRREMAEVYARLRTKLDERQYIALLEAITEGEK